eukprot:CAMPEP_0172668662 /NCGR_PEP_ID=MMETSP1074-20121228/9201_1 /TAXON_ID=2916 /ORGANISM="Ceratium fusus, Strain PA161109" /LENGTH=134 /DNA_ID=CAMNT_0013485329 /DNA_START=34 /DNA_END=438 /DNA_ORIENTATION=+
MATTLIRNAGRFCAHIQLRRAPHNARMMASVKHVVMFGFREGITREQIVDLKADFDAMPSKISEILEHESGLDMELPSGQNHPAGKNREFIWTCKFQNEVAYEAYARHPDHLAVLAKVKDLAQPGTRAAIQYRK